MLNWVKKSLQAYIVHQKQLLRLRCLVVDKEQRILKILKSFHRKYRPLAFQYVYYLACSGYNVDTIVDRLIFIKKEGKESCKTPNL